MYECRKVLNAAATTEWAPMGDGLGTDGLLERYMQSVVDEAREKNPSLVKTVKVRGSERTGLLECVASPSWSSSSETGVTGRIKRV